MTIEKFEPIEESETPDEADYADEYYCCYECEYGSDDFLWDDEDD